MNIPRYEEEGRVAVLYSPGYGAGWSSWADSSDKKEIFLFHPTLVKLVLEGRKEEITEDLCAKIFLENGITDDYSYLGGLRDLRVGWVEKGVAFCVDEYDGYESIVLFSEASYYIA